MQGGYAILVVAIVGILGGLVIGSTSAASIDFLALPTERHASSAVWDGTGILVFGGRNGTLEDEIVRYEPAERSAVIVGTLPTARASSGAAWIDGMAYVFGGGDGDGTRLDAIVRFDLASGTVDDVGVALPSGREAAAVASTGDVAYVFGGWNGTSALDEIVRYDPVNNTVQTLPARLPTPRYGASAVWDGSKFYVLGGLTGSAYLRTIVSYDPATNVVSNLSALLPTARANASAIWDGSSVYVLGGQRSATLFAGDILRFTPSTGALETTSSVLPTARGASSAVWTGTEAFLVGGRDESGSLDDFVRVELGAEPVTTAALLPATRTGMAIATDGANVFMFGGRSNNTATAQIWRFDPASGETALMGATLPSARMGASAAWDGTRFFVFGGHSTSGLVTDEIVGYDPLTDSATVMQARLPENRTATSAASIGGSVYIFGGSRTADLGTSTDQVLRYDPSTDAITLMSARLPTVRHTTSALRLGDRLIVVGGTASSSIVAYDPTSDGVTTLHSNTLISSVAPAATDGESIYIFSTQGIFHFDPDIRILTAVHATLPVSEDDAVWSGASALLFGASSSRRDVLRFDPSAVGVLNVSASLGAPRAGTSAFWDGSAAYVTTGLGPRDFRALRLDGEDLTVKRVGSCCGSTAASLAWTGEEAFVFGGKAFAGFRTDDIRRFDPQDPTFEVKDENMGSLISATSAVWNGTHAFVFGGEITQNGPTIYNDRIMRYDPATDTHTWLNTFIGSRAWSSAVWDGEHAYVFGGYSGFGHRSDIKRYDPATGAVTTMSATLPSARAAAAAVWTGEHVYLFGGDAGASGPLDEIVRYHPASDTITLLTTKLPSPRTNASAVWAGDRAYVFGGTGAPGDAVGTQIVRFRPTGAPSAPRDLSVATGNETITIGWEAPADDGGHPIQSYAVLRNGSIVATLDANVTSYEDDDVHRCTSYAYAVRADNAGGSTATPTVQGRIRCVPRTPADLEATQGAAPGEISIRWGRPPSEMPILRYELTRGGRSGENGTAIDIASDATAYNDTGLASNTRYFYRIVAVSADGPSEPSDEVSALTQCSEGLSCQVGRPAPDRPPECFDVGCLEDVPDLLLGTSGWLVGCRDFPNCNEEIGEALGDVPTEGCDGVESCRAQFGGVVGCRDFPNCNEELSSTIGCRDFPNCNEELSAMVGCREFPNCNEEINELAGELPLASPANAPGYADGLRSRSSDASWGIVERAPFWR